MGGPSLSDPDLQQPHHRPPFSASTRAHVTGLASKSPNFVARVLLHPLMLGIADTVLEPNCADIQVNVAHMLVVGAGAQAQFPHRDKDVCPSPAPRWFTPGTYDRQDRHSTPPDHHRSRIADPGTRTPATPRTQRTEPGSSGHRSLLTDLTPLIDGSDPSTAMRAS